MPMRPPRACRCCASSATPTAGGWRAGAPHGWPRGQAGGSVEVDENPADTLERELQEEWSVQPSRMRIEALVQLPSEMVLMVGQAWLPDGASVTPDSEHDDFAWWPAEVERWPEEAHEALRRMGTFLSQS